MGTWGDVNAVLNRLVSEGVISGFRTNRAEAGASGAALHVTVTTGGEGESVRRRVLALLTPIDDAAEVTIGKAAE